MKFLRFLILFLIIAACVWFMGKQIEALQQDNANPDILKNALESAKGAARNLEW
jgi:large-conductance mechanosensitive channel